MTDPRTIETLPAERPLCNGCGRETGPGCCGCGATREHHDGYEGHPFIPMGCDCYRADEAERDEVLAADPAYLRWSLADRMRRVRGGNAHVYPLPEGGWRAWIDIAGRTWGGQAQDPTEALHDAITGYEASLRAVADGIPF